MTRKDLSNWALATLLSIGGSAAAVAADNVWTNSSGNGNVMTPANWSLGHIPNNTERALIANGAQIVLNSGQGIVADQIECSIAMYLNGGHVACRTLTTNANLSTYNGALVYISEAVYVNNVWNLFQSNVLGVSGTDPIVYIAPNATVTIGQDATFATRVENSGVIEGQNHTLVLGAYDEAVFFINHPTGVIRNTNFDSYDATGFGDDFLLNEGYVSYVGGAPAFDVYFANSGQLELDAANLTVTQMVDASLGHLDSGAWTLKNGSNINHNYGDFDRIGPNVTVRLEGGQNYFQGLSRITSIQGRLELKNTTFQIAPPFFGNCRLGEYGFLRMEQGARVEVLGGFSIAPDSVLDKIVSAPNANDVIATYVSSDVGGQLIVEFQDESLIPDGSAVPLMSDIGDCCAIGGQFASVLVFGTTKDTAVDHQQHLVRLAVGDNCPADLNGDGSVGLADLAILLSHFGTPSGATQADGDLNASGSVDLADLAILLAAFGSDCP
jgi:hypothetical protein